MLKTETDKKCDRQANSIQRLTPAHHSIFYPLDQRFLWLLKTGDNLYHSAIKIEYREITLSHCLHRVWKIPPFYYEPKKFLEVVFKRR